VLAGDVTPPHLGGCQETVNTLEDAGAAQRRR
jgi:hypothetical protein